MNRDDEGVAFLRNLTVLPGHEDAYCELWRQEVSIRKRHRFKVLRAFVETGPGVVHGLRSRESRGTGEERVFTCLYSFDGDVDAADALVRDDPEFAVISEETRKHVLDDGTTRRVRPELMAKGSPGDPTTMVVMRRYQIIGDWSEFLHIWRRIVPLREQHGFPFLFAAGDAESRVLTWAFSYDGDDFDHFLGPGQAAYYTDPRRVELETINHYLEEVRLTPARHLVIP